MAATPPPVELGTPAPDFRLPATDGRIYEFADVAGPKGMCREVGPGQKCSQVILEL
jgi:hypothetical protein